MDPTILVVDDKVAVRTLLEDYLSEQGFRVVTASNGRMALYAARHEQPELILLDIMMPEMDGFEFLHSYRKERATPVIVITARDEEKDAVYGLELGADDYILKPFRMRELHARIRAVLRRTGHAPLYPHPVLRGGPIVLDPQAHEVKVRGEIVELTPTEFNLLQLLMEHPNHVVPRERLWESLSDHGYTGAHKTIAVHVRNLRRKIEQEPDAPALIETVFGVGYRFGVTGD